MHQTHERIIVLPIISGENHCFMVKLWVLIYKYDIILMANEWLCDAHDMEIESEKKSMLIQILERSTRIKNKDSIL